MPKRKKDIPSSNTNKALERPEKLMLFVIAGIIFSLWFMFRSFFINGVHTFSFFDSYFIIIIIAYIFLYRLINVARMLLLFICWCGVALYAALIAVVLFSSVYLLFIGAGMDEVTGYVARQAARFLSLSMCDLHVLMVYNVSFLIYFMSSKVKKSYSTRATKVGGLSLLEWAVVVVIGLIFVLRYLI